MAGEKIPNVAEVPPFVWNDKRSNAAIGLASGKTQQQVAEECGINRRTVQRWLEHADFSAEVDRLSLMTGIASRAERLRIAKRVVRQRIDDAGAGNVATEKDILDWLKFAQSETDGIKLDLAKIVAAIGENEAPVAGSGSD